MVTYVIKWYSGPPALKFQVEDYENKDRLPVCRMFSLQRTAKLGRTKPPPHAGRGLDIADLDTTLTQCILFYIASLNLFLTGWYDTHYLVYSLTNT